MKLKNLTMENFKSAPDQTINLEKINVFIGPNGHGKTSTENALRYVLSGKLPDDPIRHGKEYLHVSAVIDDGQDTKIERYSYLSDIFRINGNDVKENIFLKEAEKYRALCETNGFHPQLGTDTNPFFANQEESLWWTFLLTGKADGARIGGVKEIELVMYDGSSFYMRKSLPSRVMADGKKTTSKALGELIRDRMQGDEKALDLVTSSAVMSSMEMTDFAKYLISIVPVQVDFNRLSQLAKLTVPEANVLKDFFPASPAPITTSDVANAYKGVYAKRSEISKVMDEWKKRSIYAGVLPIQDGAKVRARLDEIKKLRGSAMQIKSAWDVYNRRVEERNRAVENLKEWQAKLDTLKGIERPDVVKLDSLKREDISLRKSIEDISGDIAGLERANAPILKMLSALDTTICPLCDKLVCSTDKTSCKQDLEDSVRANSDLIKKAKERLSEAKLKGQEVSARIESLHAQIQAYTKKEQIERQVESLVKTIPEMPSKPDPLPDTAKLAEEEKQMEEYVRQSTIFEACLDAEKEYNRIKEVYDLYCTLVKKCEPKKGLLTNTILEYILNPFCNHVNEFLKLISGDMQVKFMMADDGLQVYCRPHGRGHFIPVKALSTGEKMLVVFALMDMVSSISNTRIVVFDCLENLDAGNLDALFSLLLRKEIQDRYDHIFLSVVNHKSIEKIIERYALYLHIVSI